MRTTKAWSLASLIMGLLGALSAQAQSYTLAWNANPEPDVVGYKVHVGTSSGVYTLSYTVSSPSATIPDLPAAPVYYFAVTAVNSAGLESAFSDEVSSIDANAPVLTSILTATAVRLTVNAPEGTIVRFEASTDLQNWQFLANRTASAQGVATMNQSRSALLPARFYRGIRQ